MMEDLEDFCLVLSGGGALGIAHLGVLSQLEKLDKTPKEIIGTSMGGIVGACVAIGMREQEIFEAIEAFSLVHRWIKFSFSGNAIVDSQKIATIFDEIFGDTKIAQTQIPLKLITTNLRNGERRTFTAADDVMIKEALLATMAIPGIFSEKEIEGEVYGDGFLCANLGLDEATCSSILAVDVLGKESFEEALPDNIFKTSNVLDMFEKSMRLLIYNQTKTQVVACEKKLFLVDIKTAAYKTYHFHQATALRDLGIEAKVRIS